MKSAVVQTMAALAIAAAPFVSGRATAQEVGPQTLQKLLERFPAADANKDGTLSLDEAKAYRAKMTGKTEPAASGAKDDAEKAKADSQKAAKAAQKAKRAAGPEIKPDHADVSYGEHPNNKLDLWLAKSDQPTPLVVFIHGGGFVGGDKSGASASAIKQCMDAKVSFASINYRFRTEASINTVLRDSARAIQFLRSKASEWNLDKKKVAAFGGSAGAGTSLWLAFHDDLADPKSPDPVLRESTRLVAAGSSAGQATYDILKWGDVLGAPEALRFHGDEGWPAFYGLTTKEELEGPKGKELRADVDMLALISRDDPPVWLGASDRHDALETKGDINHSPKHSQAVKKRCDEVGIPCVLKIGDPKAGEGESSPVEFLLKHVK